MAKYYNSIDNCPVLLFIQISQGEKQTAALCYKGKPNEKDSFKSWEGIYNEYLNTFGVSTEYIHYMREKSQLCQMLKEFFVDGSKWQRNLIEIKKAEIKRLEEIMNNGESDFNTILGKLSKKMGFGIDPNKTTIRQFYSYLKAF